jgi:hypothetical protein
MRGVNQSVCHTAAASLCTQEERDLPKVVRGLIDLAEEAVITLLMGNKQRESKGQPYVCFNHIEMARDNMSATDCCSNLIAGKERHNLQPILQGVHYVPCPEPTSQDIQLS